MKDNSSYLSFAILKILWNLVLQIPNYSSRILPRLFLFLLFATKASFISIVIRCYRYRNITCDYCNSQSPYWTMVRVIILELHSQINDTHMEELVLYWIQYKNSLKYKVGCFWRFPSSFNSTVVYMSEKRDSSNRQ